MSSETGQDERPQGPTRLQTAIFAAGALVIVGFLVVFLASAIESSTSTSAVQLLGSGEESPAPALPAAEDGDAVPDFAAVQDGTAVLDGPVIVNFWASWCGPCREETPELMSIAHSYEDAGVTVVGVNAQDLRSDAASFLEEYQVNYPVVYASRSDEEAWGTRGFPETFIINTDGMVAGHIPGPVDQETLEPILEELGV